MRRSRSNKGFSLVELLVAMAVLSILMGQIVYMIAQTSNLYKKGSMEVNLQTEAQQLIQQLEELLIDCSVSVGVVADASTSCDEITITTHEVIDGISTNNLIQYKLHVDKAVDSEIGTYLMDRSYAGAAPKADIPMADNLYSLSVNTSEFSQNSKLTIYAELRNDVSSYTASKDIYLRNDVGVSTNKASSATASKYEYELCLLRYTDDLNLSNWLADQGFTVPAGVRYEWEDPDSVNDIYSVSSSNIITCSDTVNSDTSKTADKIGPFKLSVCDATGAEKTTIGVYTDPIQVGVSAPSSRTGYGFMSFYTTNQDNMLFFVPVRGIDLRKASKVTINMAEFDGSALVVNTSAFSPIEKSGADMVANDSGSKWKSANQLNFSQHFKPDPLFAYTDKASNSCVFAGGCMTDYDNYRDMLQNGNVVSIQCDYLIGGHDIIVKCILLPAGLKDTDHPTGVSSIYEFVKDTVKP